MRRALIVLLTAATLAAQPPSSKPGGESPDILVPAWIDTGVGLTQETMTASIGGIDAPILALRGPEDDLVLLVVLDLTGDLSLVQVARQALDERIAQLRPNHYVAVMSAQDGLHPLVEPSGDRERTAAAILSQQVGGRSGLLNTVEQAAELGDAIGSRSGVRVAVLYVTDSDIQNYREDYTNPVVNSSDARDLSRRFSDGLVKERISRLVNGLTATQTPVFVVHLDYRTDRLNEAYQTGLMELARTTGGNVWFCRSLAGIPTEMNEAVDRAVNLWSVRVALPDPEARQIEVMLAFEQGGPLDYRSRYLLTSP